MCSKSSAGRISKFTPEDHDSIFYGLQNAVLAHAEVIKSFDRALGGQTAYGIGEYDIVEKPCMTQIDLHF